MVQGFRAQQCLAIVACTLSFLVAGVHADPATAEKITRSTLGVPDSGIDAVAQLHQYYKLQTTPPPSEQRRLVRSIGMEVMNTGVQLGAMRNVVTDGVSVHNRSRSMNQPDPRQLAFLSRMSVLPILLSEVKSEDNEQQAKQLSRAALFIAANDCLNGSAHFTMILTSAKQQRVLSMAALSDEQLAALKELAEQIRAERAQIMRSLKTNSKALDSMIKAETDGNQWEGV